MIRKVLFSILLLGMSHSILNAQDRDAITGKWIYSHIADEATRDSTEIELLNVLFEQFSLHFDPNGTYKSKLTGIDEIGTWQFSGSTKVITLSSDQGSSTQYTLLDHSIETLTLRIEKSDVVFEKIEVDALDHPVNPIEITETVKPGIEEITKKWFIVSKEVPGRTQKQNELSAEFLQGSSMNFKSNGNYTLVTLGVKEKGKWQYKKRDGQIITSRYDMKTTWSILKISESELSLLIENNGETWHFTSTP